MHYHRQKIRLLLVSLSIPLQNQPILACRDNIWVTLSHTQPHTTQQLYFHVLTISIKYSEEKSKLIDICLLRYLTKGLYELCHFYFPASIQVEETEVFLCEKLLKIAEQN